MARSPWRPLPGLILLLLGGLATPSTAALDARATTRDRLQVCGPAVVRVTWTVRLGSTRVLVVESPIGRFERTSRTFGSLLRQEAAVGTAVFPELVTVPADLVVAALDGGAPVILRRRFDVLRSAGPPESVEALPLRLEVVPPRLAVAVAPPRATVRACESTAVELRWTITARDAALLDVESERGVLFFGGEQVAAPGGRLDGQVVDRLGLSETLRLTPDLTGAALALSDELEYRRRFALRCEGFERSLEARVMLELADRDLTITVTPERATVAVGRTVPLPLRWSALGTPPCVELVSSEVRVETAGGRVLARLDRDLRLRGSAAAAETLPVSAAVSLAALDLGVADLRIVREFVLVDSAPPGPANAGPANAVTARAVTARPMTVRRVVARPAVRLLLTGSIPPELSVLRLALRFEDGEVFRLVPRGSSLGALAEITTAGSGPLRATWELADPASTSGAPVFRPLQLVARYLPAGGPTVIESPDLPTERQGLHLLRLRLLSPVGDFAGPVLRYQVGPGWQLPTRPRPPSSLPLPPADPPLVEDDDPIEEREVLALSAGLEEAVALEALGLELKLRYQLKARWPRDDGDRLVLSVLRVPHGVTVREVVRQIRRGYPDLWVDANDRYAPQLGDSGLGEGGSETKMERFEDSVTRAKEDLRWGPDLVQCPPQVAAVKIGTIDTERHAKLLAYVTKQLVGRADVAPDVADDDDLLGGAGSEDSNKKCSEDSNKKYGAATLALGSLIDALQIALALDNLGERTLVQLGIAGRPNQILRYIFKHAVDDHLVFVAPFNNCNLDHSYPASSERVIGVVALGVEGTELPKVQFFAAPQIETCKNSCAVPLVTAALWVMGAGSERTEWEQSLRRLEAVSETGVLRLIKAPSCER